MGLRIRFAGSAWHGRTVAAGLLAAGAAAWLLLTAAGTAPNLVALPGHVHPLAQARFDAGEAPDSLPISGLELVLAKTPAQEQALEALIEAQQDPKSPQYHRWLAPAQYGERFGASDAAVASLSRWLTTNGFRVDPVPASRAHLNFHGSKAQVEAAFRTRIHLFDVQGERHFANVSAPLVPATLAPLIMEISGLHNFYPKPGVRSRPMRALGVRSGAAIHPTPDITYDNGQENFVGPGDFAIMYNLLPLYKQSIDGAGVTIAIAAESDINTTISDAYWTGFGLTPLPLAQFTSEFAPINGTDPGQTNDGAETEAFLDVELAGGLAQGANVLLVRNSNAYYSAQYVIDQNLAGILSISFGACENALGASNGAVSSLFEQAATAGITVIVASGDNGVAGCFGTLETQGTVSNSGFAVSGIASTPYDLAVGGTDFDPTQQQAWATSNASGTLANAEGHIPEIVWNDTCANPIFAKVLGYTTTTFCNTSTLNGHANPYIDVFGSNSGQSSCLSTSNNACQGGYPQPSWQKGVYGIQGLNTRAVPDVAVTASAWVICSYDTPSCDPATQTVDFVAGTSAAAPSVAAIIALLDQTQISATSTDGRQGLINPLLYRLATAEYGTSQTPNTSLLSSCSASLGLNIGSQCVFYNVVAGSSATPCEVSSYSATGSSPASTCAASSGDANGIMELGGTAEYGASAGFNLATGLGSINATELVAAVLLPAPAGVAASNSGQTVKLTWTAEPNATTFNVFQGTQAGQEGATPVLSGATGTTATVSGLTNGQIYYFTVQAVGSMGVSVVSSEVSATIVPAAPGGLTATAGTQEVSLSWTAPAGATSYNVYQGTSSGGEGAAAAHTVSGTSLTISGLTGGTTYYFKVAAVDAGGVGAMSAEASATPTSPKGGGGAFGWLELALLALLAAPRCFASRRT